MAVPGLLARRAAARRASGARASNGWTRERILDVATLSWRVAAPFDAVVTVPATGPLPRSSPEPRP
jgi:hypothetical protein